MSAKHSEKPASTLFYPLVFSLHARLLTHQGKSEYVGLISEELQTHATVYQTPGHASNLPSFIRNHGLLSQERFIQLLRRAKVVIKLQSWRIRIEHLPHPPSISCLVCSVWWMLCDISSADSLSGVCRPWVSLRRSSSHWSNSSRLHVPSATLQPTTLVRQQWLLQRKAHHKTGTWRLTPKTRLNWIRNMRNISKYINDAGSQISSQHPYAEKFIGKPHVWTVDVTNKTDVREAVRAILRTEVRLKASGQSILALHISSTVALYKSTRVCFCRWSLSLRESSRVRECWRGFMFISLTRYRDEGDNNEWRGNPYKAVKWYIALAIHKTDRSVMMDVPFDLHHHPHLNQLCNFYFQVISFFI